MSNHKKHDLSLLGYITGFILSVILTLLSFIPVMQDMLHDWTVAGKILYLIGMALLQIAVQVFYFLHLHYGENGKWNVGTFFFGAACTTIVIGGTWWAMQHLNYNMMGGSGRIVTPPLIEEQKNVVPAKPAPKVHLEKIIEVKPIETVKIEEQKKPIENLQITVPSSEVKVINLEKNQDNTPQDAAQKQQDSNSKDSSQIVVTPATTVKVEVPASPSPSQKVEVEKANSVVVTTEQQESVK